MEPHKGFRDRVRGDLFSRMRRYPGRGWVAGICAGIAEYFDWNVKLVRLIAVLLLVCGAFLPLLIVYLVFWYLMAVDDGSGTASSQTADPPPASRTTGAAANPSATELKARFTRLEQRLTELEECVVSREFDLRRELRKLES